MTCRGGPSRATLGCDARGGARGALGSLVAGSACARAASRRLLSARCGDAKRMRRLCRRGDALARPVRRCLARMAPRRGTAARARRRHVPALSYATDSWASQRAARLP